MVAYSFRPNFVDMILAGLEPGEELPGMKRQTIRAHRFRGRHARPGEAIQLYAGMRTKHCRLLGVAECTSVERVLLRLDAPGGVTIHGGDAPTVRRIGADEPELLDQFAQRDGFPRGWAELLEFWAREHPDTGHFAGVLIRWRPTS
ncbi:hypothetical protein HL658_31265 [Azospirillum sp. RWY-5-1]|uniref:ASCH domain-containing protein n=1 Tax=Azospirillum oleiclasticum TaxID=2735135 RepID=A0ABX2TJU7_9PROT|nr:hypothetical protein [Azospirillum oleiclasticum]NYZ17045.1 hypothetical protein [Azospirillum oleiclasticum]NYZ24511.1 hypothetical protein [Azospirillum oleiclasticum]